MSVRPVFVLGTGRCGSTLVHELLARHELTGFVTNLDDLGLITSSRLQVNAWRRLPAGITEKGRVRFAPSEGYRVLEREVSPLIVNPVRDLVAGDATPWLARRLWDFVDTRAARLRAPVFLHKFTGWPRAGLLAAVFPDARFIHVVRDGRAVANSWLQMPWWRGHRGPAEWHLGPLPNDLSRLWDEHDRSFVVLAGLAWRLLIDAHEAARATLPADRWINVRYEDVVADPRTACKQMLEHIGLQLSDAFEAGLSRYELKNGRTDVFRRDLSQRDVVALEAVLGTRLARYGYA